MAGSQKSRRYRVESFGATPDDLYDYLRSPKGRPSRPAKDHCNRWTVTDDWPEQVPVTDAEVDVFEAWFGDLFDELFATRH
jgi:hypothetical protein